MKKEVKKALVEVMLSILVLLNTISFMFPNGVFSKLSLYFMTQAFIILI